jgi:transcriptional regulator with XRE-family HTH domain
MAKRVLPTTVEMAFGDNIRRHRTERSWTIEELARRSGLHPTTVSRLERGVRSDPSLQTARDLARALRATVDELAWQTPPHDSAPLNDRAHGA